MSHDDCSPVVPAPARAVEQIVSADNLPGWNEDWGKPVVAWRYQQPDGGTIGFIVRFEKLCEDGTVEKNPIPLTYARDAGAREHWHWKSFPEPRPLYNLERLAANSGATIVVVEGEKCASGLQDLFDEANIKTHIATTWPGGANKSAIAKTDWAPLHGRNVIVFPDHDKPGFDAAMQIARTLENAQLPVITRSVRIVKPESDWPAGHDVADLADSTWNAARVLEFIAARAVAIADFEIFARERFGKAFTASDTGHSTKAINPDIARLAALSPIEYDQQRKVEANRLGVRGPTLDAEVEKARKKNEAEHPRQEAPQWAAAPQLGSTGRRRGIARRVGRGNPALRNARPN